MDTTGGAHVEIATGSYSGLQGSALHTRLKIVSVVEACERVEMLYNHPCVMIKSIVPRQFHLCLPPDTIESDPDLLALTRESGITDIWTTGFLYGYWVYSQTQIQKALEAIGQAGLIGHVVNVPLGHPGDSLGAKAGDVPLSPPPHWRMGVKVDGEEYSGTSIHPPAIAENSQALQKLQSLGVRQVFLDDDFRLAVTPGMIGGCFCSDHRIHFEQKYGVSPGQWELLVADIQEHRMSSLLRQWVDFTCDELTAAFQEQQAAAPQVELGIMVMYLGSEKGGLRLTDYSGIPFRVGESMFNDSSFNPVKGKTDELFSVLFHRRFTRPEQTYSETTAFPADQLSAANLAAKLNISLISDVRNTMFMSGLTPFPRQHWSTLGFAIRRQSALHPLVAGQRLHGPFKHYWGPASRFVGDDNPYSLFLALGIPFEVVEEPPQDGWVFLSKADAQELPRINQTGMQVNFVSRPGDATPFGKNHLVEETLPALFEFKHRVVEPQLHDIPYVMDDIPMVCAWYPEAQRVLIWNLSAERHEVRLKLNDNSRIISIRALDVEVCEI